MQGGNRDQSLYERFYGSDYHKRADCVLDEGRQREKDQEGRHTGRAAVPHVAHPSNFTQACDHVEIVLVEGQVPVEKCNHPQQKCRSGCSRCLKDFSAFDLRIVSRGGVNHLGRNEELSAKGANPHQNALPRYKIR